MIYGSGRPLESRSCMMHTVLAFLAHPDSYAYYHLRYYYSSYYPYLMRYRHLFKVKLIWRDPSCISSNIEIMFLQALTRLNYRYIVDAFVNAPMVLHR